MVNTGRTWCPSLAVVAGCVRGHMEEEPEAWPNKAGLAGLWNVSSPTIVAETGGLILKAPVTEEAGDCVLDAVPVAGRTPTCSVAPLGERWAPEPSVTYDVMLDMVMEFVMPQPVSCVFGSPAKIFVLLPQVPECRLLWLLGVRCEPASPPLEERSLVA